MSACIHRWGAVRPSFGQVYIKKHLTNPKSPIAHLETLQVIASWTFVALRGPGRLVIYPRVGVTCTPLPCTSSGVHCARQTGQYELPFTTLAMQKTIHEPRTCSVTIYLDLFGILSAEPFVPRTIVRHLRLARVDLVHLLQDVQNGARAPGLGVARVVAVRAVCVRQLCPCTSRAS